MRAVSPLKNKNEIELVKMYLKSKSSRNYTMFIMGINSNLRITDLLNLKTCDVWSKYKVNDYIEIKEQKTNKTRRIRINENMRKTLKEYIKNEKLKEIDYLFPSNKGENNPISRQQAHYILSQAGDYCGLEESLSPHSLRKTWAYWAWKSGVSPVLIMEALNHSSWINTKRYIGITQDELDEVYINLNL